MWNLHNQKTKNSTRHPYQMLAFQYNYSNRQLIPKGRNTITAHAAFEPCAKVARRAVKRRMCLAPQAPHIKRTWIRYPPILSAYPLAGYFFILRFKSRVGRQPSTGYLSPHTTIPTVPLIRRFVRNVYSGVSCSVQYEAVVCLATSHTLPHLFCNGSCRPKCLPPASFKFAVAHDTLAPG